MTAQPNESHRVAALPLLFLWVNGGCNARCRICEIWRNHDGQHLSLGDVCALAREWALMGGRDVQVIGEPTLHPEFPELLESLGIPIHLLSNGLTLWHHAARVHSCLASVTVSLDGPPEVHDAVRNVPSAYECLQRTVSALRALSPSLPIVGRCVVHRLNRRLLSETVETAHALGLSSLSFLAVDTASPAFGRDRLRPGMSPGAHNLTLDETEREELAESIDELVARHASNFASGFIVEPPDVLRRVLLGLDLGGTMRGHRTPRCNAPWVSVVVEPDGLVRPCFFLPAYGTLRSGATLREIVNSPGACQARAMLTRSVPEACRACVCPRWIETNPATPGVMLHLGDELTVGDRQQH